MNRPCYTNLVGVAKSKFGILKIDHRFPWEEPFQVRSFDSIIILDRFQGASELANKIFNMMEGHEYTFPHVTGFNNNILMTWNDGNVWVRWLVNDEGKVFYYVGNQFQYFRYQLDVLDDLPEMISFLTSFLRGTITIQFEWDATDGN